VNAPILKLFGLVLVLFMALIAMTSYNSVINADAYRTEAHNRRPQIEEQRVHRGVIRARDGSVLARSVLEDSGLYTRRYSDTGAAFAHAVGYDYLRTGHAGLEREYNDELTGKRSELTSIVDELRGRQRVGDSLVTNLDPEAQRVAIAALQGRKGSVVAIEPASGKVRVMVSSPGYDPNTLDRPGVYTKLATDDANSPLLNRATQGGYVPGSTFKVLTAAAALDSGKYTPDSVLNGDSPQDISGVPMANDGDESYGDIPLSTAMQFSVNTVFGQIGESLGKDTMGEYMRRFGFYAKPPLDYPEDEMIASGERLDGRLLPMTSDQVDVGRVAIGQDKLAVTPLQMAMVVAAVANRGVLMEPRLTERIVDPDGRVRRVEPSELGRPISADAAEQLNLMMRSVVESGTGTAVQLPGIQVAGKTGTAQVGTVGSNVTQPSFVAFAPADDPRIAIAVTVERSQGGFGGTVAAPIARAVLESLLNEAP
jgi:peptidoglycan glycosyltransferase